MGPEAAPVNPATPPSTTDNALPSSFASNATPLDLSRVSGSAGIKRTHAGVDSYIKSELKEHTVKTAINSFIQWLLPLESRQPSPKFFRELDKDATVREHIKTFRGLTDRPYPEEDMYPPLEGLVNAIIDASSKFNALGNGPLDVRFLALGKTRLKGGSGTRMPDGGFVERVVYDRFRDNGERATEGKERSKNGSVTGLSWSEMLVSWEAKTSASSRKEPPSSHPSAQTSASQTSSAGSKRSRSSLEPSNRPTKRSKSTNNSDVTVIAEDVQMGGYLAEMRSALGNRSHVLGFSTRRRKLHVWYADSCGAIRSTWIDICDDFEDFARLMVGLAYADSSKFGYDLRFTPPPRTAVSSNTLKGWTYKVNDTRTVTIDEVIHVQFGLLGRGTAVYQVCWDGETRAMKTSRPFSARRREVEILGKARSVVGDGVTRVFYSESGELVSSGPRQLLFPEEVADKKKPQDRKLEIIVMEKLTPLYSVADNEQYMAACIDILETLERLNEAKILHRDVSNGNLMVRVGPDGRVCGVLIDFDLGVVLEWMPATDPTLSHRTGTLPWLAWDLFWDPPPPHCVRFDVESLFYVVVWHAANYPGGRPRKCHPSLKRWLSADRAKNREAKGNIAHDLHRDAVDLGGRSMWKDGLVAIAVMLQKGQLGCIELPHPINHDSVGWLTMAGFFTIATVRQRFMEMKEVARS